MDFENNSNNVNAFNNVSQTGVLFVTSQALKRGYSVGDPEWSNLGQGAPEVGILINGSDRLNKIPVEDGYREYGEVSGIYLLRKAVADLYNYRYRRGKSSQYTPENVAISPGGRSGVSRVIASLNYINIGHFIPDYTAYAEILDTFHNVLPIPIVLEKTNGFKITPELLHSEVTGKGLEAILLSNPNNPTGQVIHGETLKSCVEIMHDIGSTFILDEFYSHYYYGKSDDTPSISSAAFVEDVNKQSLIIIDGLSKNWRYPGLRISWTLGPQEVIESFVSTGSFLDGGASHPTQMAVLPFLTPENADTEARSIQAHFAHKRDIVLERLIQLGFVLHSVPQGSFYVFVSLENMPKEIQDGLNFFNAALAQKVICVPGIFFDVDPGRRRSQFPSPLNNYIRISYGPALPEILRGLDKLAQMIEGFKA